MNRRVRTAARAAALAALVGLAGTACSPEPEPITVEKDRISVVNRTREDWQNVTLRVNQYYVVQVGSVPAGGRFDAPLGRIQGGFGRYFDPARERVSRVEIKATGRSGPVTLTWPAQPVPPS